MVGISSFYDPLSCMTLVSISHWDLGLDFGRNITRYSVTFYLTAFVRSSKTPGVRKVSLSSGAAYDI